MRVTWIFAALFTLAGCSTPYQSSGFRGGYIDTPLAANVVRIDVRGNGFTSASRVRDIAMVRAAETTINRGFQRFIVVSSAAGTTESFAGFVPGQAQTYATGQATRVGSTTVGNAYANTVYTPAVPISVSKERATFIIQMMRSGDPGFQNGLDARAVMREIGPRVGFGVER